ADLVAVAVEEGDGIIALAAPVLRGFLEGRKRQRQHQDGAERAEGEALAAEFDEAAPPARDAEAPEEDGDRFPRLAALEAGLVEGRVDRRIDGEQPRRARALRFAFLERVVHYAAPIPTSPRRSWIRMPANSGQATLGQ